MRTSLRRVSWIERAVIYQVYPRSFQDASGDGYGDLAGIERRLDHIAGLGAAALWLSPVYPSPGVDMGYDIADFRDVDPLFGDLAALDRLVESAHDRDLRVLLDLVPCHTSIRHPWFTEHPEYYVWADGDAPPEQLGGQLRRAGLDPGSGARALVPAQLLPRDARPGLAQPGRGGGDAGRGAVLAGPRGRRLPPGRHPGADEGPGDARRPAGRRGRSGCRCPRSTGGWTTCTPPTAPTWATRVAALRAAAGDAPLVGEVYLPAADRGPYLEHLDVAFAFELLHAPWEAAALRAAIEANAGGGAAWVLSNHDFPRVPTRVGEDERPRGRRAAADPARPRVRLPGRGAGPGRRPRARHALRPPRPRRLPPSRPVGARRAHRRVHRRRAVAGAGGRAASATCATRPATPGRCSSCTGR